MDPIFTITNTHMCLYVIIIFMTLLRLSVKMFHSSLNMLILFHRVCGHDSRRIRPNLETPLWMHGLGDQILFCIFMYNFLSCGPWDRPYFIAPRVNTNVISHHIWDTTGHINRFTLLCKGKPCQDSVHLTCSDHCPPEYVPNVSLICQQANCSQVALE